MAKLKVQNQSVKASRDGANYVEFIENISRGEDGSIREAHQANPDNLTEASGYYHVDEATKELQGKVRLMLEKAKQVLTIQQYNAFVLVDLKHLKLRDAAKVMQVNHARVDQLIKRARLKLQGVYNALG